MDFLSLNAQQGNRPQKTSTLRTPLSSTYHQPSSYPQTTWVHRREKTQKPHPRWLSLSTLAGRAWAVGLLAVHFRSISQLSCCFLLSSFALCHNVLAGGDVEDGSLWGAKVVTNPSRMVAVAKINVSALFEVEPGNRKNVMFEWRN